MTGLKNVEWLDGCQIKPLLPTTMPRTFDPADPKRYIQLLRGYLKKSGRKQREMADASHVSESMLSKVLKGKAKPDVDIFCKFQAAFLVAHGGITQARQVREMAALLGDNLDEDDLKAIAKAVEYVKDPELDSVRFRDRAEAFRATIPAALSATEDAASAVLAAVEPLGAVAAPAAGDPEIAAARDAASGASRDVPLDVPAALAAWQAVLRDLIPPEPPPDTLSPDEVIAAVLDWESRQPDPEIAATVWDWLGTPASAEPFRQRMRLDYFLQHFDAESTWNKLEWQWLNHVLVETAQRQAGGAQLSPSQLAAFVVDLGRLAFEAVKADREQGTSLVVNLAELAPRLPLAQATSWTWLDHIAGSGLVRLSVSPDGICKFSSRAEAEFLAAQYLIQSGADDTLLEIARNGGRPFGVLTQAVRTLHFTSRDKDAGKLINALIKNSEDLPLRHADAAYLLAACEAPASPVLVPLWDQVEAELCESWTAVKAPAYREYVARGLHDQDCRAFTRMLRQTLHGDLVSREHDPTTLRSLAMVGGPPAVDSFQSLGAARWLLAERHVEQGQLWDPLLAVLGAVPELAPLQQVAVLESLAQAEDQTDENWRVVKALAECGTIPALRALDRIATTAADPALARYAENQRKELVNLAHAVVIAHELDDAAVEAEPGRLVALVRAATRLLQRLGPLPVLSRALARVWSSPELDRGERTGAALGLLDVHATPALDICLSTLPLADRPDGWEGGLLAHLLPALSSPDDGPRLWRLTDRAASRGQRAILVRCLGRAGALVLDERFEQLLAEPAEAVAIAAVAALADSLGTDAAERLAQIAVGDARPVVRMAAGESLAKIGSARALPYLRDKLKDPQQQADGYRQLAQVHDPEAEVLLAEAARTGTSEIDREILYLPALAVAGGPIAVQTLRELLGAEPNETVLSRLHAELPADTAARALTVWERLAYDPSSAWGKMAVGVLVQDPHQTGIETVVRVALDGTDWIVREHARNRLRGDMRKIASLSVTEFVLTRLEQQIDQTGQPSGFMLDVLAKCLSGLPNGKPGWPPDIARRALALLCVYRVTGPCA